MFYKMAYRRSCGLFQNGDGKDASGSRIRTYPFETDHTVYICMYRTKIKEQIEQPAVSKEVAGDPGRLCRKGG